MEDQIIEATSSKSKTNWRNKCLEDGCGQSFRFKTALIKHLTDVHKIEQEFECLTFEDIDDFIAWQSEIEEKTKSNYIITHRKRSNNAEIIYYDCNRSGMPKCNSKQRLSKVQGTCKIGFSCTSQMKVRVSVDEVIVEFHKTHYGHETELRHLRMSSMVRSNLASQLSAGTPMKEILGSIRNNMGDELTRKFLVTRKDLHNISKSYKVQMTEEQLNFDVDEIGDEIPITYITDENEVSDVANDVIIIIVDNTENEILQDLEENIVELPSS